MQWLWAVSVIGLVGVVAALLVDLLRLRAKLDGREARRVAIEREVQALRVERQDVLVVVRPAWKVFVRTRKGLGLQGWAEESTSVPVREVVSKLTAGLDVQEFAEALATERTWGPSSRRPRASVDKKFPRIGGSDEQGRSGGRAS